MVNKIFNLMGGEIYFNILLKDKSKENEVLNFALNDMKRLIKIFNFFDNKSSISKLNKFNKIKIDLDLKYLLLESIKFYKYTNGKFNVFLGKNIEKRKNNLNFEDNKIDINNIINFDYNEIKIENENINLDLGGIAKGYIIDKVLENIIKKYKKDIIDIVIDARGDMVFFGKTNKLIEVENPFNNENHVSLIEIKTGSIITSGHNKQYFDFGSHIIGNETDILTITLKSNIEKCYRLDVLGTYFIQLNSSEVLEKIEFENENENIECLLILKNGKILKSSFW